MPNLLLPLFLLPILFTAIQAATLRIPTQHTAIPENTLEHKLFGERLQNSVGNAADSAKLPGQSVFYLVTGDIKMGTPGQRLTVELDYYDIGMLAVIGSQADLSSLSSDMPKKHTFNSSRSSTYSDLNRNFSFPIGAGHVGQDVLDIGMSTTVKFGIMDKISGWLEMRPIDGLLGLAPQIIPKNLNATTILDQLSGALDKPLINIWTNVTLQGNGTGQATLGTEDTDHCQSNWAYVPQVQIPKCDHPYAVHVSSIQLGDRTLNVNTNLTIDPYARYMSAPPAMRDYFVNATQAVFNSSTMFYDVDCDTSKAANLTFNIGGNGNDTDSSSRKLVISGADYILYHRYHKTCVLPIFFFEHQQTLEMGARFVTNHCLGYNIKKKTIGFADSKFPKTKTDLS